MPKEKDVSTSSRYLLCTCFFTDIIIDQVKEDVKSVMAEKEKDDQYFQFINWQRQKNEIAVLTMYAYADISLPKKLDTIFEVNNTENNINSEFKITQAIFNGWATTDQIESGHKHIVVLQFSESIPSILNLLPSFSGGESSRFQIELGFCNMEDFDSIKENLKQQK